MFNYIVEHEEYFQNLQYLEITGHQLGLPPEEEDVMSRRLDDGDSFVDALRSAITFLKTRYAEVGELMDKPVLNLNNNKWDIFQGANEVVQSVVKEMDGQFLDIVMDTARTPRASM